jgi:fumarate hydratase subunit alpha
VTELPLEYVDAMKSSLDEMDGAVGKSQLENILENVRIAREGSKPMCQDTGIVGFIVKIGDGFPLRSKLKEILVEATRRATKEIPLRPNAVDNFKGNTGDNVGLNGHIPIIYLDLVEGDDLELVAVPKGGGRFVIEALSEAGSLGCPPYFVGVGVGGGEDYCMYLAKKALLKPFHVRNPDPEIALMEKELLEKVNQLGVGAMGLGEGITALDLHIEMAARHPASLPVGIVLSCWALRHAKATITSDGEVLIDKTV